MIRFLILLCAVINAVKGEGMAILNEPDGDYSMDIQNDPGMWTGWLDGDSKGFVGDFETIWDYQNPTRGYDANPTDGKSPTCRLWCRRPLAVKWRLSSTNKLTNSPAEVEKCVVLKEDRFRTNTLVGFECVNANQMSSNCSKAFCSANSMLSSAMSDYKRDINCDRCPNFEVNYLCSPSEPRPASTDQPCAWQKREMKLRELEWQQLDSARALEHTKKEVELMEQEELRQQRERGGGLGNNESKTNDLKRLLKLLLDEEKH
jgi:hypothetical protein